jgi:hypothetical protein
VTSDDVALDSKLESIFMPYAAAKRQVAIDTQLRFVHYTSATAALEIIKSKSFWMRSSTCMADFREVQHGTDTLRRFLSNPANHKDFVEAIDGCAAGLAKEAFTLFDQWWAATLLQTYITSISEHDDSEDMHGRLSMWRAFGRTATRVALVFRLPLSSGGVASPLNILFSPVAYFSDARLDTEMKKVIGNIRSNQPFLKTLDRSRLLASVFMMLVAAVTCMKHEGFHEEREWRVIYSPKRDSSPLIKPETQVIDGVPQIIYRLPLDRSVSTEIAELDIAGLIDRVIIGPTQYVSAIAQAFEEALLKVGLTNAGQRIFASGIPMRTGP